MSFTDKLNLKQRVRDWFARNDTDFVARCDDFVELAEQRIYYGAGRDESDPLWSEPLRVKAMETTSETIEVVNGAGGLPDLFLEHRAVSWLGSTKSPLSYRDPLAFWDSDEVNQAGTTTPRIYTIEGSTIRVAPAATGTLRLSYFQRFAALAADNDTNWILTNLPALYLHATMLEAGVFAKDAARTQTALQQYRSAVAGANRTNLRATFQGPLEPVFR